MNIQSPLLSTTAYDTMLDIVADVMNTRATFGLSYYAWPEIFPSTAVGDGIGGQAVTTRTVHALSDGDTMVIFTGSMYTITKAIKVLGKPVLAVPQDCKWAKVDDYEYQNG